MYQIKLICFIHGKYTKVFVYEEIVTQEEIIVYNLGENIPHQHPNKKSYFR